jgi:hypothetical protein
MTQDVALPPCVLRAVASVRALELRLTDVTLTYVAGAWHCRRGSG